MKHKKSIIAGALVLAFLLLAGGLGLLSLNMTTVGMPAGGLDSGKVTPGQILSVVMLASSIAALVMLLVWVGRTAFEVIDSDEPFASPEELLQARLAHGEITYQEFEQQRHALNP